MLFFEMELSHQNYFSKNIGTAIEVVQYFAENVFGEAVFLHDCMETGNNRTIANWDDSCWWTIFFDVLVLQ